MEKNEESLKDLDKSIHLLSTNYGQKYYSQYAYPYFWRWLLLRKLGQEQKASKDLEMIQKINIWNGRRPNNISKAV